MKTYSAGGGDVQMNGKFTADQKYQIVMESFNSGVAPVNFRKWREKFIEGGKKALAQGSDGNQYEEEIDELKKIIADQSLVINELKKYRQGGEGNAVLKSQGYPPGQEDIGHIGNIFIHCLLQTLSEEGKETAGGN